MLLMQAAAADFKRFRARNEIPMMMLLLLPVPNTGLTIQFHQRRPQRKWNARLGDNYAWGNNRERELCAKRDETSVRVWLSHDSLSPFHNVKSVMVLARESD